MTPLHAAAFNGQLEAVKFLTSIIENPNPIDANGASVMNYAAISGHYDVIDFYITHYKIINPTWQCKGIVNDRNYKFEFQPKLG